MPSLSPPTLAFLGTFVRSQLHIDILLLLCRDTARWWHAGQLAAELGVPEDGILDALEQLASSNLLDVRIGSTLSYRFSPVDEAARTAMCEAVQRPYEAREAIARQTRRPRAAERIAEAFRIRKSDG